MNIPTRHLSVRVPWHDAGWNGKVCNNPRENGSCMFLPRINESKDPDQEEELAGQWLHEIAPDRLPPCISEKVHFMSPHKIYRKASHPYSKNPKNKQFYGHYKETTYCYPEFSFSVIPYNWMLKDSKTNGSVKAADLQLNYDPAREPKLNFENSWVQQIDNQRALLDTFISPIKPGSSLVFLYAKNIPFVETTSRILIGVGHISSIGKLTEYEYDKSIPNTFQSTLWERPIYHTIRDDFNNGFLLPYQELFTIAQVNESIFTPDYVALAPSFEEFSFGSEWVSNDTAIESLLILAEKLKKFQELLPDKNYDHQLKWIDTELSRIWKMRGPFPGLGAVLSGLKLKEGNFIAWELDKIIREQEGEDVKENPWDYVEKIYNGNTSFLPKNLNLKISDTEKATWRSLSTDEKEFIKFLSRMNLDNDQVDAVIDLKEKVQTRYLKNPYLLYESNRLKIVQFPVSIIDKAIFSNEIILQRFPLYELTDISASLDHRRIRAYAIQILELEILNGNTLLTDSQLITKFDELPVQPLCDPSLKNLNAVKDFLSDEVIIHLLDEDEEAYYFKLARFDEIKNKIKNFVKKRIQRPFSSAEQQNWLQLINNKFGEIDLQKPFWYQARDKKARAEKAQALHTLSNSRFSALIGPAGTGKTTLLKILCEQPFISDGTILRLAPTGKAKVNMGKEAKTLATFLYEYERYDPETQRYFINQDAEQANYNTVIVDESSMLTEEQFAALIDSLTGVERFILVGDYRQLPPIGAGRPFVDCINFLTEENKGIAELKLLFRQFSEDNLPEKEIERLDVRLSKWFSDDDIKKEDLDIFTEIAGDKEKNWDNIKFIEWDNVKHLEEILIDVTNIEIASLISKNPHKTLRNHQANFDASLGSNYYMEKSNWSGFAIESGSEIENWQILSPTRTSGYGTKILNQKIQQTFRGKIKEKAIFPGDFKSRKMHKPVGEDSIVFSDKVMNVKNTRWNKPWNKIYNPDNIPDENILKYIANGEIGIHIGKYGKWDYDSARPLNIVFSSQPGYAYIFKESDFQEDGDVQIELAYSITIHKSQGSGFKVVLLVLPNPCPVLSRELFYTAMTRQEDRIVILHQGSFNDFRKYTSGEYSETGRRLTDLFLSPTLKIINKKYYDTKYIQISEKGEFMISKSEVIIADKLYNKKIPYVYEAPISDSKGVTIHPDFTIEDKDTGIIYYWEHLGMLTDNNYRSKWKRKKEWYERNGIIEYTLNSDADKQLIITRDKSDGGIDSQLIKNIIEELFL